MHLPNLLIAGAQKSGTTWLHVALSQSKQVFGSKRKELNYFNKGQLGDIDTYRSNFPDKRGVKYYFESTPHYFRAIKGKVDIAERVSKTIPDAKIIVVLRDPVARYESAYIHHMMRGRFPYEPIIDNFSEDFGLIRLGQYAKNLTHWQKKMPDIGVFLYDDLLEDKVIFVDSIMSYLEIENDIRPEKLEFRRNDKSKKIKRAGWDQMPKMSPELRQKLYEYFQSDIDDLEVMIDRDLGAWRFDS
ncbi:Sulfotransferase domain-containing protein [Cognatiyoonia sediminum]|uniref:Sulfotransferase domain-containing protein n=1 Tax=Cognatiyoonia sediminum TaxID=1508389 RepID=A0A1M5QSI9_9RHOB|nr:sulfotransferase [Cognatiyoonia sediminum]SHH17105.1 Sulfotransferase domain-containing protein [Cognatiyoonia sediminum]